MVDGILAGCLFHKLYRQTCVSNGSTGTIFIGTMIETLIIGIIKVHNFTIIYILHSC